MIHVHERIHVEGRILFHAFPADLDADAWQEILKMPLEARRRCASHVAEFSNIITQNGKLQILSMIGNTGTTLAFSQYFAIGTTSIISVQASDTSVPGEFYRTVLSSFTVLGTQVDCVFSIPSGSGNNTYASVGIFGGGATGTLGSGTLMSHALSTYTKTSANSLAVDYLLNVQ
jgi:hypothetical protein